MIAVANKVARIVFVLMTRGGQYRVGRSWPDDCEGLGKRNSRRTARLEIEGDDEAM
jgi:hypothetical protein